MKSGKRIKFEDNLDVKFRASIQEGPAQADQPTRIFDN